MQSNLDDIGIKSTVNRHMIELKDMLSPGDSFAD